MEIVINRCWGGYSLSEEACAMLGVTNHYAFDEKEERTNPRLVDCVRTLGKRASGAAANLMIVELPSETTDWEIDEYDGAERVIYVVDGKIHYA